MGNESPWHLDFGATVLPDGVRFKVWAPKASRVDVELDEPDGKRDEALAAEGEGLYGGLVPGIGAGTRYKFRLDAGDAYPDPYSRFQPDGVHGPSEVVDPGDYAWSDGAWPGLTMDGLVLYECHVGAMTPAGTFEAMIGQLKELKRLGVTAVELMPVATSPGRWNWGYDGVDLYAPSANYGRPDDLRRLVDAAHAVGLGVILDVVYNHLGPDGNHLRVYSDDYFTDRHKTLWGDALNYDGPNSRWTRELVISNACYWLTEYHVDGLRLDATDAIIDDSSPHLLAELAERARAAAPRPVVLIAEEARNDVRTIRRPDQGGFGLDAVWADDFHHAVRVFLTGVRGNYYDDYEGTAEEIAQAVDDGFLYQGKPSPRSGRPRGTPVTDEPAASFVFCIQNHDQVGNRAFGERLHHEIDAERYAVASALLLFSPETPLLFMGQEFRASSPFQFFTDHDPELGKLVTAGRRGEFKGFRAFQHPALRASIPDPQAEETFQRSKLDLRERDGNAGTYALYRALLRLRRTDPILRIQDRQRTHAEPLSALTLAVHRWVDDDHRLLLANFGPSLSIPIAGTGLLKDLPPSGWKEILSTSERRFGGLGQEATIRKKGGERRLELPARTAVVFAILG